MAVTLDGFIGEIDRLVLKVNPIVLGSGMGMFAAPTGPTLFTLRSSRRFVSGVVVNTYER